MSVISMKQLLEAGVHFGHQTRRWNPKMAPYIYTERNGIYIIDLQKSVGMVDDAYKAVADIAADGGTILFVGTKKQAQDAIAVEAERCGMYYVNERWLGGMLTNFKTIQSRIARLKAIETMEQDGTFEVLPKKEVIELKKELAKLLSAPAPAAYLDEKILGVVLPELSQEALAAAKPVVDVCPAGEQALPVRLAALLLRIENSLPNLSKSERKVAEYIRGNPRGIIDLSVAALADACGVSDPTVVRAYKKLGFSGYEDLKLTLAQATVSPDEIIHEEISAEDSVQAVRDKVFQSAVLALQFTRDMLEPETLAAAAQLLMNARKIVIFGLGGSAPVAMDLHHKLLRLGLNAAVYTDPHLQVIACNYLDERDAVFAVSHSGSSRCVVDSTQTAKHRGAKVISLTSAGKNPLSKLADISLNTNSKETKYRVVSIASRVAALTIADSIYTYIAMRTDGAKSLQIEKSMESLKY